VHNIPKNELYVAPHASEVRQSFNQIFDPNKMTLILAHQANFDERVLAKNNLLPEKENIKWCDTKDIVKYLKGPREKQNNQKSLCEQLHIKAKAHHRAGNDVQNLSKIINRLYKRKRKAKNLKS